MTSTERRNYGVAIVISIGFHLLMGLFYVPRIWSAKPSELELETYPIGTVELAGRPDAGIRHVAESGGAQAALGTVALPAKHENAAKSAQAGPPAKPKAQAQPVISQAKAVLKTHTEAAPPAAAKAEPASVAAKIPASPDPGPGPALAVGQKDAKDSKAAKESKEGKEQDRKEPAVAAAAPSQHPEAKPAGHEAAGGGGNGTGTGDKLAAADKSGSASGSGDGAGSGSGTGTGTGTGSGAGAGNEKGGGSGPIGFGTGAKLTVLGPPPAYPKNALNEGKEGKVRVRILVHANGALEKIQLLDSSGDARLDNIVLNQIRRNWKFAPTSVDYFIDLGFIFNARKAQVGVSFENAESR